VKWAKRDGFLAEDFDIVILIPLRSVQQKPIEDVMMEHIGEETYRQVKKSAGSRCLVILEGLDELAAERRESDPFLVRVVKECTLLEEATIIITSRPHACKKLTADRRIEVIGFGKNEIQKFAEKSFSNDIKCIEEFLEQLKEYPHLESLSYVPMNLVMIIDIFECNARRLPSTITQLYQLFIVMILERQFSKEIEKQQLCLVVIAAAKVVSPNCIEDKMCKILPGIPEEALKTLLSLSRLAYCGFFDWYCDWEEGWYIWRDPKIIFTLKDLQECGIEVTAEWDGYGLLKATHAHQLPTDTIMYNFSHLTIQEFLCAIYISILSKEEQLHLFDEYFLDYCNVFIFLCGVTGLNSHEILQYVSLNFKHHSLTLAKCLYESQHTCPPQPAKPITMNMSLERLLPYDLLCVSHVLSYYPVSELYMAECYIEDKGAEWFGNYQHTTGQQLKILDIKDNNLSVDGLVQILKVVNPSECYS